MVGSEQNSADKMDLPKDIPARVMRMLNLPENEKILLHLKVASNIILKNGKKQVRTNFFITTENLIFLDYYRFNIRRGDGFREKECIPLSKITSVEARMKKYLLALAPVLIMETSDKILYEIVFNRAKRCRDIFGSVAATVEEINEHVFCKDSIFDPRAAYLEESGYRDLQKELKKDVKDLFEWPWSKKQ